MDANEINSEETAFSFRRMNEQIYGDFDYNTGMVMDPKKTALVIVDMQPAFMDSRYPVMGANAKLLKKGLAYFEGRVKSVVIPNIRRLLTFFRQQKHLVVYIVTWSETDDLSDMPRYQKRTIARWEKAVGEQVYRKWNKGMDVCQEIAPLDHELVVPKRTGSAFTSSVLPIILDNAGIETVILTGVNTNGCVFETAVVGKNMGFEFIIVNDCTACYDPRLQEEAETWMARHFGLVFNTGQTMEMLKSPEQK